MSKLTFKEKRDRIFTYLKSGADLLKMMKQVVVYSPTLDGYYNDYVDPAYCKVMIETYLEWCWKNEYDCKDLETANKFYSLWVNKLHTDLVGGRHDEK